jgi:hypothetical protein
MRHYHSDLIKHMLSSLSRQPTIVFALLAVAALAVPAAAQQHVHPEPATTPREGYQIDAHRTTRAPDIDGALDDEAWTSATLIDTFTQQEPANGAPATERTEVRILYDAERLYIALHAFDADPSAIIATEMRRDSPRILDEDNFQIILDTFRDSRSGYMFVTNPLGAKLEQQIFEEGGGAARGSASNVNRNWDGVWSVAARRTGDGWTAEIAIPMVTVRSPEVRDQAWGINFMRSIRHKNEQVYWAPIPKPYGLMQVSLAGTVSGMSGLTRGLDLRIKPFFIGGGRTDRLGPQTRNVGLRDVGVDVKKGLGSGLSLDLTVNTDFAQAEVDEQQVNLTRFPLFFPEKRDFFLENSGQFTISNQGIGRLADLFFSRRVGLSETGQEIPIVGGARVTGKMSGHNIAIMNLQTRAVSSRPGENFFVSRYSKDFMRRSKVGGLFVNKEGIDSTRFNRTIAADALIAPTQSFSVHTFLAKTSSPGVADGDLAFHARAQFLNPKWNTSAEFTDIGENFNAEAGFVPRKGIRTTQVHLERNPRPGGLIRVMEPMMNLTYTTDQNNRLLTRRVHNMVGTRFQNGAFLNVVYNRWFEQLDRPFNIQTGVTIPPGAYSFGELQLTFNSNPSRRLYHRFQYSPQTFYDGTRTDMDAAIGVRANSQASAELSFSRNDVDLPWGGFVVNLALMRFDYAMSPRMTLRSLSQFNSLTRQISNSVRYNFVYRPGSDLYIVYDDLQGTVPGLPEIRNRQILVKMTYLLSR